jgi:probable O-glycosylation ligase (exosortase A-associated)
MLRALFVIAILAFWCAKSLQGPFYALLFYLWLAYFRPESWVWFDFISQLDLSFIVGILVVLTTLLSSEKLRLGVGSWLMLAFLTHSLISTILSPYVAAAWPMWLQFAKQMVMSLAIVSLVNTEERLRVTFGVIGLSLAFEATKQGWAQLVLNPGAQNDNTHPVFGDNNGVAVGMLMLVSILVALGRVSPERWAKLLTRFAAVGVVYRGLSTYSRGGFLSCGALAFHYVIRSRRKTVGVLAIAAVSLVIVPVLPTAFWSRMNTIDDAVDSGDPAQAADAPEPDYSTRGRLHFWKVGLAMAQDRPFLGVGHGAFETAYKDYDTSGGEFGNVRAAHSAWFGVMGDLGFVGFALFVILIINGFRTCIRAQRLAKGDPTLQSLGQMAMGIEGALVVYCIGGSFVSHQYLEMHWHMLALSVATDRLVRERVTSRLRTEASDVAVPSGAPAWRGGTGMAGPIGGARPLSATTGSTFQRLPFSDR